VDVPSELREAVERHARATRTSVDAVVESALAAFLGDAGHTAFQVSTTGALVEGVYAGAAEVGHLRVHGDFGLGTFEGLDGELVALDGRFFQVRADASVHEVDDAARTPFAVVTRFAAQREDTLPSGASLTDVALAIDALRDSDNLFFAVRVDGRFGSLTLRAACRVPEGTPLAVATTEQSEWVVDDVTGTMVGFWSPTYSGRFDVPGYHLHFLDDARTRGGHVLGCTVHQVTVGLQRLDRLEVELPETVSFLRADLSADPAADLDRAEHDPR
jgi:acetolactate decarboxylase